MPKRKHAQLTHRGKRALSAREPKLVEGERQLLTRLRHQHPQLTLVLVSHRRASLDLCDRVLNLVKADG